MSHPPVAPTQLRVVLLGDHETAEQMDLLTDMAAQHGATVVDVFSFHPGAAARVQDLTEIQAVLLAVGRAIQARTPIWLPYPREDLWREQHFRRLSIVLQRHGLNLLWGSTFEACPTLSGTSEMDLALRAEVRAVDELDRAALAAVGIQTLEQEIAAALPADGPTPRAGRHLTLGGCAEPTGPDVGPPPPPVLPSPKAPWPQRQAALKCYAQWLVQTCGLTQTAAAQCLNPTGHRTPQGQLWKQATVSALIKGRYDRC